MIKVVVLDFDDTICLTEKATFELENEIATSMGFKPMTRATHQKNWGKTLREAIIERVPGINVDNFMEVHERVVMDYYMKGKLDSISKENLETIDKLKSAGLRLAIVTSRNFSEARHLIHENHPLSNKIEAFYHRDNSEFIKPDPRVFDKVFAHFKVNPNECVYVGDAVSDAVAAKSADMHFIAVLESGLRSKEDFKDVSVDKFVSKFKDIESYILGMQL